MSTHLSQQITQRLRAGRFVLSAFQQQGPAIAARAHAVFAPHLEPGDATPDLDAQIVAYRRLLEATLDRLQRAELEVLEISLERAELRRQRDRRFRRLHRMVLALRRGVLAAYLEPDLTALGLAGANRRDPLGLWRQADLIVHRLREGDVPQALGEPLFEHALDPRQHADELAAAASELRAALDELDNLQRRYDERLIAKHAAKAAYDHAFQRTAHGFEELCRLAGEDELAARVRPSRSRPGRTHRQLEDAADEPGTSTSEAASGDSGIDETASSQPSTPGELDISVTARPTPQRRDEGALLEASFERPTELPTARTGSGQRRGRGPVRAIGDRPCTASASGPRSSPVG